MKDEIYHIDKHHLQTARKKNNEKQEHIFVILRQVESHNSTLNRFVVKDKGKKDNKFLTFKCYILSDGGVECVSHFSFIIRRTNRAENSQVGRESFEYHAVERPAKNTNNCP